MNTATDGSLQMQNVSSAERVARAVVGAGMILSVFAGTGPLGALAITPILALYPTFTALLGWDPVYAAVRNLATPSPRSRAGEPHLSA